MLGFLKKKKKLILTSSAKDSLIVESCASYRADAFCFNGLKLLRKNQAVENQHSETCSLKL